MESLRKQCPRRLHVYLMDVVWSVIAVQLLGTRRVNCLNCVGLLFIFSSFVGVGLIGLYEDARVLATDINKSLSKERDKN